MSSENQTGGGTLGNLKFNTVGREEAAAEVLVQQVDPAVKTRNMIIWLVALAVLIGIVYVGFQQSGKKIFENNGDKPRFEAPVHDAGSL